MNSIAMVCGITEKDIANINTPEELRELVSIRLNNKRNNHLNDICFVITSVREVDSNDA